MAWCSDARVRLEAENKRSAFERCEATTPKGRDGLRMQTRVNDARERNGWRGFYNKERRFILKRFNLFL